MIRQPFHGRLILPNITSLNPKRLSLYLYRPTSMRSESSTSQNNNFFEYTSGRWIRDETQQMLRRYRQFNVEALKKVNAEACGAQTVVGIEKIAEGSYNKIFNIKVDNGKKVIARIPTPLAGPDHLVTASEVATMDYIRSLGVPIPRVLAWCSNASSTSVESEYIIMEKAQGIELGRVWDKMTPN